MAYQFIHIEAVSKAGRDLYQKNKKVGNISINSILGEAGRYEGYIEHVEKPLPPVILYGDKEKGIESISDTLNDWYEETKDARGHKARVDANALLASVVSWPPISDNEDENEYINKRDSFEADLIKWLKKVYSDDLRLVLRHDDEPFKGLNAGKIHYHWHYFCVKKPGQKFDLHPGFLARSEYNISRKDREKMSKEEISEKLKEGKKAYREIMIDFQDRFYQELGRFHGLARMGPMRPRLSRSEQVELEKFIDKELAYPKKVMDHALIMKAEAISIQDEAEVIKKEAEEIKQKAKDEGKKIINKSETEAKNIIQRAENKADKTTKEAEEKAKVIVNGAWNTAKSIIKKAERFISHLLNEVSKLSGGDKVVEWAKTFIKFPNKPELKKQNKLEKKENQHTRSII
jgi:hypothetical protein